MIDSFISHLTSGLDGELENFYDSLQRILIHGIDRRYVLNDKKQSAPYCSNASIDFSCFADFFTDFFDLNNVLIDLFGSVFGML